MEEKTTHKLYIGDSRRMDKVGKESVHLVVTSPPYYDIKDYGVEGQIGFGQSYDMYLLGLHQVFSECHRALMPGCRICVNVGDVFKRGTKGMGYHVLPIHAEIIKDLSNLFDFTGTIIWHKRSTMNTSGGAVVMGSYPFPASGVVRQDFEYILLFRKPGYRPKPTKENKEKSIMTKEEWNTFFKSDWFIPGTRQDRHMAMFPLEIPRRLIKMFSFVGDTVLDPFMGSGTTALAAAKEGRSSIGYELNGEFGKVYKEKMGLVGKV